MITRELDHLSLMTQVSPDSPQVWIDLGRALERVGRKVAANTAYLEAHRAKSEETTRMFLQEIKNSGMFIQMEDGKYLHKRTNTMMVLVPSCIFEMGHLNKDKHLVGLDAYLISEDMVKQTPWLRVMGTFPSRSSLFENPVEQVSWTDCQNFCEKTGLMLPTEAQWECAARKGFLVGLGIMREWCRDWDCNHFYNPNPVVNPTGPEKDTEGYKRLRGDIGSHGAKDVMGLRGGRPIWSSDPEIGFRVVFNL